MKARRGSKGVGGVEMKEGERGRRREERRIEREGGTKKKG